MKIILFLLFCGVVSVQSKITLWNKTSMLIYEGDPVTLKCNDTSWSLNVQSKITSLKQKTSLIYEGDPVTLKCNDTSWSWNKDLITDCKGCPANCKIQDKFKERIEATCKNNETILHFISTNVSDTGKLKCPIIDDFNYLFLVGREGPNLYPENGKSYALSNLGYTLICKSESEIEWYSRMGYDLSEFRRIGLPGIGSISIYGSDTESNLNLNGFNPAKHNGKIIGCRNSDGLLLYKLTVYVPVESVIFHPEEEDQIENKNKTFRCIVLKSKPKPLFLWQVILKNGSTFDILNASDKHKLKKGKVWETTSTIKLELKKEYSEIKCGARIIDMPYVNDTFKLNILYAPDGKPNITSTPPRIFLGDKMQVTCEWKGGHPEADVELSCLSENKTGKSNVTIEKTETSRSDKTCICKGKHVAKNTETQKILDIQYAPEEKPNITSTLSVGGKMQVTCEWKGGHPEADIVFSCLSEIKTGKSIVIIEKKVTSDLNKTCICKGKHVAKIKSETQKILDIPCPNVPNYSKFYIIISCETVIFVITILVFLFIIFRLSAKIKNKKNLVNKTSEEKNEMYDDIKDNFNNSQKTQPTNNDGTYEELNDEFDNSKKTQPQNNNEANRKQDEYENHWMKPQQIVGKELPYDNVEYIAVME